MPPIININPIHIMGLISIYLLITRYKDTTIDFFINKNMLMILIFFMCSVMIVFLAISSSTKNFDYLKSLIYLLTSVLPTSILASIIMLQRRMKINDFFKLLLVVAFIQSLISLLAFLVPSFKQAMMHIFYYNQFVIGEKAFIANKRIFGFTMGFTYAMPVVQGFMAFVAFVYAIIESRKYIIYIPFLLFSASVNARVGLLVFLISTAIFLLLYIPNSNLKIALRALKVIALALFGFVLVIYFIGNQSPEIKYWILSAYEEIKVFLFGESMGYFSALERFIFFPKGIDLALGAGRDYFHEQHPIYRSSTDVGFVNDLFLGGIVFTVLLYSSIIKLYLSGRCKNSVELRYFPIIIVLLSLILNIKGYAFRFNEFTNLFVLISVFAILYKSQSTKEAYSIQYPLKTNNKIMLHNNRFRFNETQVE